ncbi:hypothetical protein [Celerinatantimonas yamalensis]|uniref:MSHA biogenesis protein MshP n=1 Tax=Celerinatantimonas yamalensis TaxID=559956 RepID=A0ABW9GBD6_9GAMM
MCDRYQGGLILVAMMMLIILLMGSVLIRLEQAHDQAESVRLVRVSARQQLSLRNQLFAFATQLSPNLPVDSDDQLSFTHYWLCQAHCLHHAKRCAIQVFTAAGHQHTASVAVIARYQQATLPFCKTRSFLQPVGAMVWFSQAN